MSEKTEVNEPSKKGVSMDVVIDLLLEKYPKNWGFKVPKLDSIGRKIRNRNPMYGTKEELLAIVSWKRVATGAKFDNENSKDDVRNITKKAFAKEQVTKKVETLGELNQISTAMASAILRFVNPAEFGTVDWRNWYILSHPTNELGKNNVIFKKPLLRSLHNPFSSTEITSDLYMVYITILKELATKFSERTEKGKELGIIKEIIDDYPNRTPAEIDMAIFSYSWMFIKKPRLAS